MNEVARVYGLQSSPIRRFSAFSFSIVLALDGALRTFGDAIIPHHHSGLWLQMYSLIDYGPLNIFSAALLATDGASVLYYNHTALQVAKALRLLHPLLNASLFLSLLLSRSVHVVGSRCDFSCRCCGFAVAYTKALALGGKNPMSQRGLNCLE